MFWEVHPDGPRWSLRRTSLGRVVAALGWAAAGTVGTFVGGFLFYGFDWVGRIAAGVAVPPTFWLTVSILAIFGGFFGFVARMLRYRHWVIDREARTLGLSLRRVFADPQVDEVSFDDLRRIVLRPRGVGRRSEIVAEFTDGVVEPLAVTRFGAAGFPDLARGLRRAFDETAVSVALEE